MCTGRIHGFKKVNPSFEPNQIGFGRVSSTRTPELQKKPEIADWIDLGRFGLITDYSDQCSPLLVIILEGF